MTTEGTGEGIETGAGTGQGEGQAPAWLAQMPADLKGKEDFTSFKTIGDLGKSYLEIKGKASEADGLKAKLQTAIFKPGEDAKPEEITAYRKALGVPEKPTDYEFPKREGVEHDPKMVEFGRNVFHQANLSKDQAKIISQAWDGFVEGVVTADLKTKEKSLNEANQKLKADWGPNFDKNMEITKRAFTKFSNQEFTTFLESTGVGNHPVLVKTFYEIGKAMGEDTGISGSLPANAQIKEGIIYDKSPPPPKK